MCIHCVARNDSIKAVCLEPRVVNMKSNYSDLNAFWKRNERNWCFLIMEKVRYVLWEPIDKS